MEPSLQRKIHIITIVRKSLQFTYACVHALYTRWKKTSEDSNSGELED